MNDKIKATLKIYPAAITRKEDNMWIETQGAKNMSVKFNRDKIDDEKFKEIFEYMLSLGYAAHTRDIFIKQVPTRELVIEQRVLANMFDLKLI